MATDTEDTGFLSRWSRRKVQVRQGVVAPDVAVVAVPEQRPAVTAKGQALKDPAPDTAAPVDIQAAPAPVVSAEPAEPAPTLQDVQQLTRDSDFKRFVTRGVQPDVKNAALAKLFTDPHFNVMDGLDVYIDDYSIPDPLPKGMLRQMLQSQLLGLFDDEPTAKTGEAPPTDSTDQPATETPADENTDLQLQPDDDAGRAQPAPGVDKDTGRAH